MTVECDLDDTVVDTEYNADNDNNLSSEKAALLGENDTTLSILPSSIDPGGSLNQQ